MSFARYARQVVLPEIGVNGQQLLRDSSVLIVGLGGLGSLVAPLLAAAGVGRLCLAEFDRVELSNLQRQLLYREADAGRPKLQAAREALAALNHEVQIDTLPAPLSGAALQAAVAEVDLVLECSDNFPSRFALNRACVAARRPLVSAAAIRFEAQLALFHPARGGPCYACVFPESGEAQETCEQAGILGPVVATVASRQALLAMKQLLGLPLRIDQLWVWDALRDQTRSLTLRRQPHCPVCAPVTEATPDE
ncbi:MAG TPA: HesA/MoeB/ThiF family protein [Nevskiaceae bacterium]|nr:HesA/MoeB/ThiF family protein [Nevskiaceae bacterium]